MDRHSWSVCSENREERVFLRIEGPFPRSALRVRFRVNGGEAEVIQEEWWLGAGPGQRAGIRGKANPHKGL